MTPVVQLTDVRKTYGNHLAVNNLSLSVPVHSMYGFIGPNGSGKTSTIRMILRIIHPDSGRIDVLGRDHRSAVNDEVGYLPEERGMYKKLTVRRMLKYYAELKGLKSSDVSVEINKWLQRFDLSGWANKKIETLSKGMAQKVQFIASVIARPRLIILDEPYSGLDPVNAEVIRAAILELRDQGATVIFSTHDMTVAERMCDNILMIYKGNKVLDGTLDQIKSQYGADTVRLRWNGEKAILQSMPQIRRMIDMGSYQELQIEGDPRVVLRQLIDHGDVTLFEVAQPSLHDIFIRIAGASLIGSDRAALELASEVSP